MRASGVSRQKALAANEDQGPRGSPNIYRESSPVLMITAVTSKPSALDDEGRRFQPPGHRSQKDVNDGDDEVAGSDDLGIQPKIHQFKCPQDVAAQYVKLIAAEVLLACDDH